MFIFKVTEPNSVPYRTHPACAKRAAYPDPPPVEEEEEEEEDLFVFNDTIEGPRAPAVKPGRVTQA